MKKFRLFSFNVKKVKTVPDAVENNGNITVKKNNTSDLIAKIGCVLIAFIIWLYVMSVDSTVYRDTFSSVPVNIVNESDGLSVLSGSGTTVDITVEGKRNIINKMTKGDILAYVDISSITDAGKYKLDIDVDLPNGVVLAEVTPRNMTVYLDNTTSVSVPVEINITDYILEEGYELGESDATTNVNSVTVTGPEAVLAGIDHAQISVSLGKVTKTVTYNGSLVLIDKSGNEVTNSYVRLQTNDVTATIPVYKYRALPVSLLYKHGYYNDSNVEITVEPSTLSIKGEADSVDNAVWSYTIDEKQILTDGTYTFNITLPDGIINVDEVSTASFTIHHIDTSTKVLTVSDITVINPNNLNYTLKNKSINVTIRGKTALVNFLTSKSIEAIVDLSSLKSSSGTVLVPVTFSFDGIYDANIYEIGTYSVSVNMS